MQRPICPSQWSPYPDLEASQFPCSTIPVHTVVWIMLLGQLHPPPPERPPKESLPMNLPSHKNFKEGLSQFIAFDLWSVNGKGWAHWAENTTRRSRAQNFQYKPCVRRLDKQAMPVGNCCTMAAHRGSNASKELPSVNQNRTMAQDIRQTYWSPLICSTVHGVCDLHSPFSDYVLCIMGGPKETWWANFSIHSLTKGRQITMKSINQSAIIGLDGTTQKRTE